MIKNFTNYAFEINFYCRITVQNCLDLYWWSTFFSCLLIGILSTLLVILVFTILRRCLLNTQTDFFSVSWQVFVYLCLRYKSQFERFDSQSTELEDTVHFTVVLLAPNVCFAMETVGFFSLLHCNSEAKFSQLHQTTLV